MEVTMDSNPSLQLPAQSPSYAPASTSPSTPSQQQSESRKRSIHDVKDASMSTTQEERTSPCYTGTENQENTDPSAAVEAVKESSEPAPPTVVDTPMTDPPREGSLTESKLNTVPVSTSIPMGRVSVVVPSPAPDGTPAAKKRKLSLDSQAAKQQEKDTKQQEKEAKEKQKQEEKLKKEEEKAKKEEEKRLKEEEKKKRDAEREEERKRKEEKRKVREEEKAAKEEEKRKKEAVKEEERRKKEEEKLKKERAQPKLNAFFAKPKVPTQSSNSSTSGSPKKLAGEGSSGQPAQGTKVVSDYARAFPDFFLQSHTQVAPPHRFERDADALQHMRDKLDEAMRSDVAAEPPVFRPSELFKLMPYKRRRGRLPASVKEILLQMQSLSEQTASTNEVKRQQKMLEKVTMKSFKFGEDVRPPYQGTYTKIPPESSANKMMRNPYHRGLPDTNYDYDSEAEWEEPEEGEDLDSEEEDEGSEDGEDDMDGFLDDEDDQLAGKRRLIVGDLEPICSDLRWQGETIDPEMQVYKIETISDVVTFPIDPFSTAYWQKPKPAESTQGPTGRGTLHGFIGQSATLDGAAPTTGKAKRAFPPELMDDFKKVVNGSDLTKTGLIEILKKRFPKVSKETLKDTLNSVASRVGQKEVEKKWVCK